MSSFSLSSPAALGFLNAFEAAPEQGTIVFPNPEGVAVDLVPETFQSFEATTDAVLQETGDLSEEHGCPYPLPSTGGEWVLEEAFMDQYAHLTNSRGRYVFLTHFGDRFESSIGAQSEDVNLTLATRFDWTSGILSSSYFFEFLGGGVDRLRNHLKMEGAPFSAVVLELAYLIYQSGQHTMEDRLIYDAQRRRYSPSELRAADRDVKKIWMAFGDTSGDIGVMLPRAHAEGVEFLNVSLCDPLGLLPLRPSLKESLWDAADLMVRAALASQRHLG